MPEFITKNFKYIEIRCPCCGKDRPVDEYSINLLQNLRDYINQPIYISRGGGIRCPAYNKLIGGYWNSAHLFAKAWDISSYGISSIHLAKFAKEIGFDRVGIYLDDGHIHVDTFRPVPSEAWVRDERGLYRYFKKFEDAISYVALFMS
jgi:uncharacterized protein YcbK (DUF882 family)